MCTLLIVALFQLGAGSTLAQPVVKIRQVTESGPEPQAVVMRVKGQAEISENGKDFEPIKEMQIIKQGAIVRTLEDSRVDIFFRRTGTSIRLQPSTEIKLEKMTREMKDNAAVLKTLLDLRTGRIFTVVRSFVPGSTLEIRNKAGRTIVEGSGNNGRFVITADGTHVAHTKSEVPLKFAGETGVTIIKPGQKFLAAQGKLMDLETPDEVTSLIEFDEIHALAESLENSGKDTPTALKK